MPTYRVTIEEEFEDVIEEIWRSYRVTTHSRVVEIEAEDEEEAENLAMDGEGTIISEDIDYGDSCESEYYDTGEVLDSNQLDLRVAEVETLEQASARAEESRRLYEQMLAEGRARHRTWMERKVYGDAPSVVDTPSWKL